jgi:hypothetical protein
VLFDVVPEIKDPQMITTRNIDDTGDTDPTDLQLSDLYDQLQHSDQEHGDVSVTDEESGWCLSAHRDGRIILANLIDFDREARHMHPISKDKVLELWLALRDSNIDRIEAQPWKPGYS